jgi:hypothetical protein
MIRVNRISAVLLIALFLCAQASFAQSKKPFKPRSGAPSGTPNSGAARGADPNSPKPVSIFLLAPNDTVGLTAREKPVFYFYLSNDTDHDVEFSIIDKANPEVTIIEKAKIPGPHKAGIHPIKLSEFKQDGKSVALEAGVKYELAVQVVVSATQGSMNSHAECRVKRLEAKELPSAADAEKMSADKQAIFFRDEGVWFDYIDAINRAIEKKPKDAALLEDRAAALESQGITQKDDGTLQPPAKKKPE